MPWLSEKVDDIGIEGAPQQWWAEGSLFQPITWQVHESAGPDGQENVSDVNSPVITNDNYEEIAADLQPQTSHKYPGKPKQEMFWSRPLVERHELFHCREHKAFTQKRIDQHRAWLAEQTASTAEEARALLDEMLQEVDKDVFKTDMAEPGREKRAYADGSIEFRKLSSEIKLKGATGGYLKSSKGKPLGYPEP